MQIRKIGPQPTEQFSIVPNGLARDRRLSFRARGIMVSINSHADGYHVNADTLAEDGREGRDAIRKAMNELIECNYLRRVRRQTEDGRWRTDINVYPYGDAPPFTRTEASVREVVDEDFTDDGFSGVGPPTTDFQASVDQASVNQSVIEDQLEDHSLPSSSEVVAAAPVRTDSPTREEMSRIRDTVPLAQQRQLQNMGVTDGGPWTAAWQAAVGLQWPDFAAVEAHQFPAEHLSLHLIAKAEQGRAPSPSRWLRFYLEDRAKRIAVIADEVDRRARDEETPQEREDRYNRRRLPEWTTTYCPGCGCEPSTEPHREGCTYAAKDEETQA